MTESDADQPLHVDGRHRDVVRLLVFEDVSFGGHVLVEGQHQRLDSLLELSAALQVIAHKTPAHAEAVNAFIDKREPRFGDE